MHKKFAFLLALLLTAVFINLFYIFSLSSENSLLENVIISRIIDGDTLELEDGRIVRLANINTPEKNTPYANESADFLSDYLNKTVQMEVVGTEKYGRTLARLYSSSYINLKLVEEGLAYTFLVSENEDSKFKEAERLAMSSEKGMWKRSEYYGCISLSVNPKKEEVLLKNLCNAVLLKDWRIKDESRKEYIFEVLLNNTLTVHTGEGEPNITDVFWKSNTNIWNDDRDTAYLFDSKGYFAAAYDYGY